MQSQSTLIRRVLVLVGLVLALDRAAVAGGQGQAKLEQWLVPWHAAEDRQLVVHGDARDEDGFTGHWLRVTDATGKSLLTFDGKGRLLDVTVLPLDSEPLEKLLVTHWTLGLRTTRVVVFRSTASAVAVVADLVIVSDDIGLFDLDSSGYRQMVVGEVRPIKGRPERDWPMDWVVYRWNGSALVRAGRVPAARLTPMLHQAFGPHPRNK